MKKRVIVLCLGFISLLFSLVTNSLSNQREIAEYNANKDGFIYVDFRFEEHIQPWKGKGQYKIKPLEGDKKTGFGVAPDVKIHLKGFEELPNPPRAITLKIRFKSTDTWKSLLIPDESIIYELRYGVEEHTLDKNKMHFVKSKPIDKTIAKSLTLVITPDAITENDKSRDRSKTTTSQSQKVRRDTEPKNTSSPKINTTQTKKGKESMTSQIKQAHRVLEQTKLEPITIVGFDESEKFLQKAVVVCYNSKNQIVKVIKIEEIGPQKIEAPQDTQKIEFKNSILEGVKIPVQDQSIALNIKNQTFIPIVKFSQGDNHELYGVFYKFTHSGTLLKSGILKQEEGSISFDYPDCCENIKLELEKEGYNKIAIKDISRQGSFVEMVPKKTQIHFEIFNTRGQKIPGARITIGNQVKETNAGGKASFTINPDLESIFYVTKEGYQPSQGEKISYTASPIRKWLTPIAERSDMQFWYITVQNKQEYRGNILIKSRNGISNTYLYSINPTKEQWEFFTMEGHFDRLQITSDDSDGIKYKLEKIKKATFEIRAISQRITYIIAFHFPDQKTKTFASSLTSPVFYKVSPAINNQNGQLGPVYQQASLFQRRPITFTVPFGRTPSFSIKDNAKFEDSTGVLQGKTCTFTLHKRKPALAVVMALNSGYAIKQQDKLEAEAKKIFNSDIQNRYKKIVVGYIDYIRDRLKFKKIENNRNERQMNLERNKIFDRQESLIKKIVDKIREDFSNVNISSAGNKFMPDKLWIVMSTNTLPSDMNSRERFSLPNVLNVDFISIEDAVKRSGLSAIHNQ
jgi:hypothetical protein